MFNVRIAFLMILILKNLCSVPRARNSIAVSSFDHTKNGNKRPHSIISVSSTSSSNDSSQSSGYGLYSPSSALGGATLESLYESSKEFPRSYTICSNGKFAAITEL